MPTTAPPRCARPARARSRSRATSPTSARSVAMELAPHGIRVNSLTPTATDPSESLDRAERWGRKRPSERVVQAFEAFRRAVPMQRLPVPSDYGRAVAYLASEDARSVTGT